MMMPLIRKRDVVGMLMLVAVFVAIGVLRLPLQAVLLVADPAQLGHHLFPADRQGSA